MGLIKDGTISGIIPEKRVFAVQYPGYPSSTSRAVETLGGEEAILKVHNSDASYLELRFRPEDPDSHPAFGELHSTSDLLLRVSKCRGKAHAASLPERDSPRANCSEEGISAEIVARVEQTYKFEGMSDFQYVAPIHAESSRKKKKKFTKHSTGQGSLLDIDEDDFMLLIPPLFALKDMPEETLFRPPDRLKSKPEEPTSQQFSPCFGLDFRAKDIPKEVNWESTLVEHSEEWSLYRAIVKCFQDRPIWARATLLEKLFDEGFEPTESMFKRLLFGLAYNFLYGPFRTLWIKNGYDPRNDPEARKYQMMDFRVPRLLRDTIQIPQEHDPEKEISWKDICTFKVVPRKKFSYLQLIDLDDDFIQEQIKKPPERVSGHETTGWFRRGTLERIRQHVRLRFLALIPGDVARSLERAEAKIVQRFNSKAFQWRTGSTTQEPGENDAEASTQELENTSAEIAQSGIHHQEDPNPNVPHAKENEVHGSRDDDEEEDEDIREDDEEDSEEDEREGIQQPVENVVYANPAYNIPKNCLQELLGKFPLATDAAGDQEDYVIYEQEEDDF